MLQTIGESPVHVSIGFVSCNGGTVLRNQKKCEKHEEISPQERNEDRWKKTNAKPAWQKWAIVLVRTTRRENIHANSHLSENTRQSKERGRRHGEATK